MKEGAVWGFRGKDHIKYFNCVEILEAIKIFDANKN